jgi:hypothetical protein
MMMQDSAYTVSTQLKEPSGFTTDYNKMHLRARDEHIICIWESGTYSLQFGIFAP